jgi:fructose/tagatose bisphosphate aldolase
MFYTNLTDLWKELGKIVQIKDGLVKLSGRKALQSGLLMDKIAMNAAVNESEAVRETLRWIIRGAAREFGIEPASIQGFYTAIGKRRLKKPPTVPAVNLRAMTYETARAIFRTAKKVRTSAFIFEIAKSEIGYTLQSPEEYATQILAAAIREEWKGPVFLQGDHYQVNARRYAVDAVREKDEIKRLILESLANGFYNIDIDASTLVDLSKSGLEEQQRLNAEVTAELTAFIRRYQPKGVEVSIGGEIGEVGQRNSTPEEFRAFMKEYTRALARHGKNLKGISKISIQTGTAHGGVVLPDGSIAKVAIDFETLKKISAYARKDFGLGGAVQHGASTLPDAAFNKFVEAGAAEVHLATAFQNLIYDSPFFPADLHRRMYDWIARNGATERAAGQSDEQFYYKARKKAFGPFKKDLFLMPERNKKGVVKELEKKIEFLFAQLAVKGAARDVARTVKLVKVPVDAVPTGAQVELVANE